MEFRTRGQTIAAAAMVLLATQSANATTVVLTTCGAVPPRTTAVLAADLSCGSHCEFTGTACDPSDANACNRLESCEPDEIRLGAGSRLELRGHTLRPGFEGSGAICGQYGDRGTCSIVGPGTIAGQKGAGVRGGTMSVVLRDLIIGGSNVAASTDGRLTAIDVTLLGDRENGLSSGGDMVLRNVVIDGYADVVSLEDVSVRDVVLSRSGIRAAGRVRGSSVQLRGGSIQGRDVDLRRVSGAFAAPQGVPGAVIAERRLRLTSSSITGNMVDGRPDIVSGEKPKLLRTQCGRSGHFGDRVVDWSICSDD